MRTVSPVLLLAAACAAPPPADALLSSARAAVERGVVESAVELLERAFAQELDRPSRLVCEAQWQVLVETPRTRSAIRASWREVAVASRATMVRPDEPGEVLELSVRVVDGASGAPVPGAHVELVHVDASGRYQRLGETGGFNPRLFAQLRTDRHGVVEVVTIRPGYYAADYAPGEPAHAHFSLRAAGYRDFDAELRFADDPRLAAAPRRGLPVAEVTRSGGGSRARVTLPLQRR